MEKHIIINEEIYDKIIRNMSDENILSIKDYGNIKDIIIDNSIRTNSIEAICSKIGLSFTTCFIDDNEPYTMINDINGKLIISEKIVLENSGIFYNFMENFKIKYKNKLKTNNSSLEELLMHRYAKSILEDLSDCCDVFIQNIEK